MARRTYEDGSIRHLNEALRKANSALQKAEKNFYAFVLFPLSFPGDQLLYVYTEVIEETGFISISLSPDEACYGAKYCSLGGMKIQRGGFLKKQQDISGKEITEVVKLDNNLEGYFTPGHPMGDYWPPSLQWVYKGVLYDLWWNEVRVDRKELIYMANQAITDASFQDD